MPKGTPVEQALGNLYMVMNRPITHLSPKIQDAQTPEEQLALAITYCFDIQRKLEYACHALEAFADYGDPELAQQLRTDDEELCDRSISWEQRKHIAHRIMLEVFGAIHEKHGYKVKENASRATLKAPFPPGRRPVDVGAEGA
jgi:hypothetical protein